MQPKSEGMQILFYRLKCLGHLKMKHTRISGFTTLCCIECNCELYSFEKPSGSYLIKPDLMAHKPPDDSVMLNVFVMCRVEAYHICTQSQKCIDNVTEIIQLKSLSRKT